MEKITELWAFLKNPVYQIDENTDSGYRLRFLGVLLVLAVVLCSCIAALMGAAESIFGFDIGTHAIEKALEDLSPLAVLAMAVILAPLIEELIFRAPMVWFKNKSYFRIVFWVMTLLFAYIHITNFEITTSIMIFSLLLVMPQLILGAILGFIRVRFSLLWAIAFHAVYNLIILGPVLLLSEMDIPFLTE